MKHEFDRPDLAEWLATQSEDHYHELDFGLVRLNQEGMVVAYNQALTDLTGVTGEYALGKHFFTEVAPCTNNFMVAEKYSQPTLDETLPYMFTYVTAPMKVRLRLIKDSDGNASLLAVNN
jgi:photoactive yellow protein